VKYRVTEILGETTLETTAQTKSIPLNLTDPISGLIIEYKNTRGSVTSIENAAACLPAISLVDGSNVIFSLSAKEMMALAHYDKAMRPYSAHTNMIGVMELLGIPYNFGRKLWDPNLAFDPKQFKNPVLNISHSMLLADGSASAHYLRILAFCFDEKQITPSGFLMSKEVSTPAWVASGSKVDVVMPTDYPIRKLLLRGYLANYYPYQVINHVKISEELDKKVPLDEDVSAWVKFIEGRYPIYREKGTQTLTTTPGDLIYPTPHFDLNIAGTEISGTTPIIIPEVPQTPPVYAIGAAATNSSLEFTGTQPHACFPIDFGDQDDMTDWYDVTTIKNLHLIMTGGAAGSSSVVNVVAQQLRSY
jgi:hypothetical protein